MQQFEGRRSLGDKDDLQDQPCGKVPYELWLKLFGLIDNSLIDKVRDAANKGVSLETLTNPSAPSNKPSSEKTSLKRLTILTILTLVLVKRAFTMVNPNLMINTYLGDVTGYWLNTTVYFQFPLFVYILTALFTMRRFVSHEKDLKCFIPFAPIPEIPIPCQCYKKIRYKTRIRFMTLAVVVIVLTLSLYPAYPTIKTIYFDPNPFIEYRILILVWVIIDCFANLLALGIISFSLLYFDCVCLVIGNKFRSVEDIIDETALRCLKKRKEPQIFSSLTELFNTYLDVNDICTDSDSFWGKVAFYIIFCNTALFLFVTYSFIYGENNSNLKIYYIMVWSNSLFVLYKICQSCYDVSYAVSCDL